MIAPSSEKYDEPGTHECVITDGAGITKVYEAVTNYCGFQAIEAGKTMGLSPYGKPNNEIPPLFTDAGGEWTCANRHVTIPTYSTVPTIKKICFKFLRTPKDKKLGADDLTVLENLRDPSAYAVQQKHNNKCLI